jgi:tetratricopeptide (TPR) repeat protein
MAYEANLYNPAEQSKEWLIEHFVVRTKVFNRIFDDIKTSAMQHPEQHYLIQGQRGMGKTTLLLRLKYEIENTEELKDWLMPVFFNEDSYDLTSLSNLWEKLLKYFDEHLEDGGGYYDATDKFVGSKDYEQLCFNLVTDILHKHKRKIVLLFDNFGELFLDNLKEKEEHRLREILMTSPDIRIIAGSAVVLENTHDYKAPFFDFFKIINLEGLNKEETYDLIKKLQEKNNDPIDVEAHKARIDTLTILTGGVIRTIVMLYEILLTDNDGSAIKDLDKILDRVTPLYKHRMEGLKPQQRRIMDVVAKNWDAISAKDIARNIRDDGQPVPSKVISAQLQELEKNNFVEKIPTSTKNNLYIVKERFFNIWYLMRHGDKNSQCRVKWLTRFLETWYRDDTNGLENFINDYIKKLQSGKYISSSAITYTNALVSSSYTSEVNQALLLYHTESIVSEAESKYLLKSDQSKFQKALSEFQSLDFEKCLYYLEQISPKDSQVIGMYGAAYYGLNEYDKCIFYLSQVPYVEDISYLSYTLGLAYYHKRNFDSAIKYLVAANKSFENDTSYTLGLIYLSRGEYKTAIDYLLISAAYNNMAAISELICTHLKLKNYIEAEAIILDAIELEQSNWSMWAYLAIVNVALEKPITEIETAYKNAEKYISPQNIHIIYHSEMLLWMTSKKNKGRALELAKKILLEKSMLTFDTIFSLVWNDHFEVAMDVLSDVIDRMLPEEISSLNTLLLLMLAKKQYHSVLKIFTENKFKLRDQLKPTYYALMYILRNEYPDEILKMGSELHEPVLDILKEIKHYAIDYA